MDMHQKLLPNLKLTFWLNIAILIIATIILMYINGPAWGEGVEPNVTFERYAIIVSLICIPLALKLFHSQVKKSRGLEENKYLEKYRNYYFLRLSIIDIAAIFNLVGFYLFESQNLVLMAVICIFALFFCYPGKDILKTKEENREEKPTEEIETKENINTK